MRNSVLCMACNRGQRMRAKAFVRSCVAITFVSQCAWAASSQTPDAAPTIPGVKTNWHGFDRYDFKLNGQNCILVTPKKAARGKPWIWRARFFGHEPQADLALLAKGYHLAYTDVAGLYGSPKAIARWDRFYRYLTQEHGLAAKVALEGLSRGGLIIFNWAAKNPDKVASIYADAAVCDFKSWPGGKGRGEGSKPNWAECLKAYGLTEEEAMAYKGNPIDDLQALAKAGIPLLHVCGDADKIVPIEENTRIVERRYKELGGSIQVIVKPGVGHHPHSLKDPRPIVEFVLQHSSPPRPRQSSVQKK